MTVQTPHHLQTGCSSWCPTNSDKALKANETGSRGAEERRRIVTGCSWLVTVGVINVVCRCQSTDESSARRVSLLADMHLRHLREKMILRQRIEEVTKRVEVCTFLLLLTYRTAERVSVKREWTSVCSHYSRRLLYRDDVLQCILGCGCELDVHGSKQMFSWQFLFNKFLICLRMGVSP